MAKDIVDRLEQLLDALPMATAVVGDDRRVLGWNVAAEALYGYARVDVLGRDILAVLFEATDRAAGITLFDRSTKDGTWDGDHRVVRSDGTLLVSSFRLAPLAGGGAAWIATDGIDQSLAEQERAVLLSAEHAARATAEQALGLIEAIFGSAPVAIAVFDLHLRYVRVNDAYAALSGVAAAEHVGGRLGDVIPPSVSVIADLRRVVNTGRLLSRDLTLAPDGGTTTRHFSVNYFPVHDSTGVLVGAGLVAMEISELKRAEAERAALLARAESARGRLSVLAAASAATSASMDLDQLLERLTRAVVPAAADWGIVALFDPLNRVGHLAASHRDRSIAAEFESSFRQADFADESAIGEVVASGLARRFNEVGLATLWRGGRPGAVPLDLPDPAPNTSGVIIPLENNGRVIGVFILAMDSPRLFDDDDLELAVEVAQRTALAISNVQAYLNEHRIAETLQRALLPETFPSTAGLDIAVRYIAASDEASVGGDWYDVLPFDDGSLGLVIGDVVGHDIHASTSMGQLRTALRAYAYELAGAPSDTINRINRLFDALGLTYGTCVFGTVDKDKKTFTWANAGHPPPLLVRRGRSSYLTDGSGIMLGVSSESSATEGTVDLRAGDLIVLYTDGLIERRNEDIQEGLDRVQAAAAAVISQSPEDVCEALVRLLASSPTRHDDVAILVAKVSPPQTDTVVHHLAFDQTSQSIAVVRGFTAGVLQGTQWEALTDTAVLLASELATNAVCHARGPCAITISFLAESVEIAVDDGDRQMPSPRTAGQYDEAGRGLLLIEALADQWGVRQLPGGKRTWLTMAFPGATSH